MKQPRGGEEVEEVELFAWLANLWDGRMLIFGSTVISLLVGFFYVWWAPPIYQTEAMLQIQGKKEKPADAAFSKMEGLFAEPAEAQAEIEIIKSNLVLGCTVEALSLDVSASPVLTPLVGDPLARHNPNAPRVEIETLEIPTRLRGQDFFLRILPDGAIRWEDPNGSVIADGKPGETLTGSFTGEVVKLKVLRIVGPPGQRFHLLKKPMQDAIEELRQDLDVSERGKLTNILGLTFRGKDPARCPQILNQIVEQYVRHKGDRKSGEIAKAQSFLQEKMPELKAKLDAAENRLNQFRSRSGAVDLSREADIYLQQSSSLGSQISALKQKREELLRTYKDTSDVVQTVDQQISKLQQELGQVESKVRVLPNTQQEVVRLSRDVQVATDLYTALLNNMQQLQVSSAGELGSVVIVDRATQNSEPVAPKKPVIMIVFFTFGMLAGMGLAAIRRAMRQGITDHRVIETKLGLPVLVTIPHSKAQEQFDEKMRRGQDGLHLLAAQDSTDLAVESLRSLRTMLNFSMKDAPNSVIMFSGPSPMIGKSFVSANYAVVLAQAGARVLLVDADLRRGNLHKYFGLKNRLNGLSEIISGQSNWKSNVHEMEIPGLGVITTGLLAPNPLDLLMTSQFSNFLAEVSEAYDYVIVDAPPILPVSDAVIIGSNVGTILLVAKYGQHSLDEIRTAQKRFESHGIHPQGCVFNDIKLAGWGTKYRYSNYLYHYGQKK